ncbi:MAG: hypothetical protein MJ052_01790 [Sphaerochaetaceae bacterium]|nr:hypothetical protein [Sphaerochaetaceae bacterium]
MKKLLVMFLLVAVCVSVFANQKLYMQDSDEIKRLETLFRRGGRAMPAFIYPVAGSTLVYTVEKSKLADYLSGFESEELDALIAEFNGSNLINFNEEFGIDPSVEITLSGAFNSGNNYSDDGYARPVDPKKEKPFAKAGVDLKLTNFAFAHFEYEFSRGAKSYSSAPFVTGIPFIGEYAYNDTAPFKTYLNIGMKNISVSAGRYRVGSGSGVTGNLATGDNFNFRDTFQLNVAAYPFNYQMMINLFSNERTSNFDHPTAAIGGVDRPIVVTHKVSVPIAGIISLSMYESMMDYSSASPFDLRILNPFGVLHNTRSYMSGSNNFFGFEVDYAVFKGLSLHVQTMFDQIQFADERKNPETQVPGAFGFLTNAKYSGLVKNRRFNTYLEFAYTSPWMYLKTKEEGYLKDNNKREYWWYDLVVGNYEKDGLSDPAYLGYKYGPNAIAVGLGGDIELEHQKPALNLLFRVNGESGLYTGAGQTDEVQIGGSHVKAASPYCWIPGHVPQFLLRVALSDRYKICNDALEFNATVATVSYFNYQYEKGQKFTDVFLSFGFTIDPMKFIKRGNAGK